MNIATSWKVPTDTFRMVRSYQGFLLAFCTSQLFDDPAFEYRDILAFQPDGTHFDNKVIFSLLPLCRKVFRSLFPTANNIWTWVQRDYALVQPFDDGRGSDAQDSPK